MWRMTDDYWDLWHLLHDMFERCEKWAPHVGEGAWPDCDMLPLGHLGIRSVDGGGSDRWTRFTRDEQVTMMSLWAIFRSPLMFGGEMRDNDEWTLSLLTNEEVLKVHREGRGARQLYRENDRVVWIAEGNHGASYVALFNIGDEPATLSVALSQLNASSAPLVRDLWKKTDLGQLNELSFSLPPHSSMLLQLTNK
ncbi:Isomalto-dextranase precursor [compost metagenome]